MTTCIPIIQTKKTRVLIVVGKLCIETGIAQHILGLAKELSERGHEVAIATRLFYKERNDLNSDIKSSSDYFSTHYQSLKFYYFPFPNPGNEKTLSERINSFFMYINCVQEINKIFDDFKPDVVHNHSLSVIPCLRLANKLKNTPIVTTIHSNIETRSKKFELDKLYAYVARHLFVSLSKLNKTLLGDLMIASSSEIRHQMISLLHIREENIRLIHHGVDERIFRPVTPIDRYRAREALGISQKSKVVCLKGSLVHRKGHDILVPAIAKLREEGIDIITIFSGTGKEDWKQKIEKQAIDLGVDDLVNFVGYADTYDVLAASDILAAPSRSESFLLVGAEAMLCGIVLVRTLTGGSSDQVEDGVSGYIVPRGNSDELALKLKSVLLDDKLRMKMANTARQIAINNFTLDTMLNKTISAYNEMLTIKSDAYIYTTKKLLDVSAS